MNNKMIGAIACVIVVLVAGIAIYLTINTSNDDVGNELQDLLDGRLTIFGNANEDDYLNEDDVKAVKSIIAGELQPTYFDAYFEYEGTPVKLCLADANCDGVVDESDLQIIEDLVDRKQGTTVRFYDVDSVVGTVTYPITTMAVAYKSNFEAILICGAEDNVIYACDQAMDSSSDYYQWYHDYLKNAVNMGNRFTPDYEVFIESGNGLPSAFITGTRIWYDINMEDTLSVVGIDVVRLPFWEDNITVSGIITLGFLINCEDAAYEYAEKSDSVVKTIEEAVASIPVNERPVVFAGSSSYPNRVMAAHAGVQEFVTAAGGVNGLDLGLTGGTDLDGEGILSIDPDWICFSMLYGFLEKYDNLDSTKATVYNTLVSDTKYFKMIEETNAYKNGNVLIFDQGMYMGPASYIAVAYLANHIYSDLFEFDCDALFADYLDSYHPGWSISDFEGICYYEMEDVNEYYSMGLSFSELSVASQEIVAAGIKLD